MVSRLGNSRNCQTDQHMTAYQQPGAVINHSISGRPHAPSCLQSDQLWPNSAEMSRSGLAQTQRNRRRGRAGHAGGGMSGQGRGSLGGVLMLTEGGGNVVARGGSCLLPRLGVGCVVCVCGDLCLVRFPGSLGQLASHRISWPITGPVLHGHDNVFA